MFSVEMAVFTVVAALRAEFWAPIVKVVFTVVVPPVMLIVASVLLPVAKPAATVFTPIVTTLMLLVPPVMFRMAVASPVELPVVSATLLVAIVMVPIVEEVPPMVTVPDTFPVVSVVPVRAAMFTVVASRVPVSKAKTPVPDAVFPALRPPTAKVPSSRSTV